MATLALDPSSVYDRLLLSSPLAKSSRPKRLKRSLDSTASSRWSCGSRSGGAGLGSTSGSTAGRQGPGIGLGPLPPGSPTRGPGPVASVAAGKLLLSGSASLPRIDGSSGRTKNPRPAAMSSSQSASSLHASGRDAPRGASTSDSPQRKERRLAGAVCGRPGTSPGFAASDGEGCPAPGPPSKGRRHRADVDPEYPRRQTAGAKLAPCWPAAAQPAVAAASASESRALQEIAAVAADITRSLDGMDRSFAAGDDGREQALLSSSLQEIREATHRVQSGLEVVGPEGTTKGGSRTDDLRTQECADYDDPTLARARRLAALTRSFCDELDATSHGLSAVHAPCDKFDKASLTQISDVTKRVCEKMAALQCEPWAMAVWSSLRASQAPDASIDSSHIDGDPPAAGVVAKPRRRESVALHEVKVQEPGGAQQGAAAAPGGDDDDLEAFLAQEQAEGEEVSEAVIQRWQTAFKRFKVPDSSDLHTGDVIGLIEYLGHVLVQEEIVEPLVKQVTNFDYLDFDEFCTFMGLFIPREKQRFIEVFKEYDEDQSGEVSVEELKHLLRDLGFIPLTAMLREALAIADKSGNGELDFEEFQTFMAVYRRFEGFTKAEVVEFRRLFDHYCGASPGALLPAEALGDALVQGFGLHVSEFAEALEASLKSGQGLQKSTFATGGGSGKPEFVTFPEFLIFARKIREASLNQVRVDFGAKFGATEQADQKADGVSQDHLFHAADLNGDGKLTLEELRQTIKGLGHTPLRQNLEEVFSEVDKNNDMTLDFDEFFDFLMIFRQREGFRLEDVESMRSTFNQFDGDGTGEISALELAEIFRELGYRATLEEIHVFVLQVDANGSNELDFREFLRLMRLHREEELKRILGIFDTFKSEGSDVLPAIAITRALEALGPEHGSVEVDDRHDIDFETFVEYADMGRNEQVKQEKKKAGFTDDQIAKFRERFNQFDKDRSGEIDSMELLGILKEFDWQPKNREEQQQFVEKMERAQVKAEEAGVPNSAENGSIDFWTFVQLSRILQTEHDHAQEQRLNKLMVDLRFSAKEVEEFRHVFHEKKKSLLADDEGAEEPAGLPRQAIRRLIFMLGIEIKGDKKSILDNQLDVLGCGDDTLLGFEGFLRLMRWLMDTGWLSS